MKIAILGAGIGGLTLAQCLKQMGLPFHLFESRDSVAPLGAGIWVPPNAMQIFAQINKDKEILSRGIPLEEMRILDLNMKTMGLVEGGRLASKYLFPTVSIARHELHSVLLEGLPSEAIHLGYHCESIKYGEKGSTLSFRNGHEADFDLIIGADGIHSMTRKTMGDNRQLQYSGQTCLRGITKLTVPDEISRRSLEIWGTGARFGCSPVGVDQVYWYAPFISPAGQTLSPEQRSEQLNKNYPAFPELVQKILGATVGASIIHTDLFELPPSKKWAQPGSILLGDAAHSMTPNLGQGAAMAIEDAYALSSILANSKGSPAEVVDIYLKARVERVNQIASWARQLGQLANWQNPLLCRGRNFLLSHLPKSTQEKQLNFIYGHLNKDGSEIQ